MLRATPMLMGGGAGGITLPQTVFATSLYTGTGAAQTINNGIDFTQGGLVWTKSRSVALNNAFVDSVRGGDRLLLSNATDAEYTGIDGVQAFNANGYRIGTTANLSSSGSSFVGWSFRQAPKFFQIVTYVGDGTSGRQIPHTLGVAPGMMIVKRRDGVNNWAVYHRSLADQFYLILSATNQASGPTTVMFPGQPTASSFQVGNNDLVNTAGAQYVAYLFAHDPDTTNGIIQCGSFTTDASGNASVNLGWQPQFYLVKSATSVNNWLMVDATRGWASGQSAFLAPNLSNAESTTVVGGPTATGFTVSTNPGASQTGIFMAIRAPIFQGATRPQDAFATDNYTPSASGVQTRTVGVTPSLVWQKPRNQAADHYLFDSVRGGGKTLGSNLTNAENDYASPATHARISTNSYTDVNWGAGVSVSTWIFVRKPKFFDIVTYTGDGTSGRQIAHGLGVAPGMVIIKGRSNTFDWLVYHKDVGSSAALFLNTTAASFNSPNYFSNTAPTSTQFTLGTALTGNQAGQTYVAYLFAHDPDQSNGIVQCGSFTEGAGTGATVTLGWKPQFLLVKPASNIGDWYLLDTSRGWISGNDSTLSANTSAAEASTDFGAPTSTGFTFNPQQGNGAQWVYLAIRSPTT